MAWGCLYSPNRLAIFSVLVLFAASLLSSFYSFTNPKLGVSPPLGAVASYSVLAGTTVTCTGAAIITGDVGVSPGTAITGFPAPCTVGPPGTLHSNDVSAAAAQADNVTVFAALDQVCDQTFGAVDLSVVFAGGAPPGVYCSTSSFALTGNLNLIGSGVWIFKAASTVITGPDASVTGGDACNIWWRVGSSATLDTGTAFKGNIFALTSITLITGATLDGRALAQNGAVTLDTNIITGPVCQVPTSTPTNTASSTFTPSPTASSTSTGTFTATPTPSATNTATPTNTSTPTPTNTPTPTATFTGTPTLPIAAVVATLTAIAIDTAQSSPPTTLPQAGGAESLLVSALGGIGAIAVIVTVRVLRALIS